MKGCFLRKDACRVFTMSNALFKSTSQRDYSNVMPSIVFGEARFFEKRLFMRGLCHGVDSLCRWKGGFIRFFI